ncbi:16S rRNA (guanine(527)-N(7))-methyltransferase RsmG [Collinsella tanakaei]|uniref:16S rRNA (guanine(527)-N(7))-methyltransferase RsmG n=1 Tax=Collinsella tanakaei TaxID=626935 RepID=UPI0025A4014A|nr:16S rRNA (guanine(527)-N(7))-methyltransferase RsmG [Collinsella tanakaei]MDM8299479.1 16S rRNA (guanine(527)-N(7))-methyltransferase RsmG [Collinsella tanakaei]
MSQHAERPIILTSLDDQQGLIVSLTDELAMLVSDTELEVSRVDLETLVGHLLYVEQINDFINLTRITDLHDALVLHILDSLLFGLLTHESEGRFLDMGTGAGFPGIPFHVLTNLSGVLLDSVGKKVKAVAAIADALHLDGLQFAHARVEHYAGDHKGEFAHVMARAMASLPILIEYATPLLKQDGSLLVSKGQLDSQELEAGLRAAEICGLTLNQHISFDLPRDLGHRELLSFVKTAEPSLKLPRAAGVAKRKPLA